MLQGLSERTLKCMVIDLSKKNSTMEETIRKLEKEKSSLEYGIELHKSIIDGYNASSKDHISKWIGQWIEEYCEPADVILAEDGKTLIAPTPFKQLYDNFSEWCVDNINLKLEQIPDMRIVKQYLKKWQEKSQYGLNCGKRKDQSGVNGYEANMLFNLKISK